MAFAFRIVPCFVPQGVTMLPHIPHCKSRSVCIHCTTVLGARVERSVTLKHTFADSPKNSILCENDVGALHQNGENLTASRQLPFR